MTFGLGCKSTLVQTRNYDPSGWESISGNRKWKGADLPTPGMIYYLPMQYFRLTIERSRLDIIGLKKEFDRGNETKLDLQGKIAEAGSRLEKEREKLARIGDIESHGAIELKKNIEILEATLSMLNLRLSAVDSLLINIEKKIQLASVSGLKEKIDIELMDPVADTSEAYVVSVRNSPRRHDHFILKVSENGLLQNSQGESDDKILDSVLSFTDLVLATKGIMAPETLAVDSGAAKAPYKKTFLVDLTNPDEIRNLNDLLTEEEFDLRIRVSGGPVNRLALPAGLMEKPAPGLFYRVRSPIQINIVDKDDDSIRAFANYNIPNTSMTGFIPIQSSSFVKTEHNIIFSNGILTSQETTSPSELAALAKFLPDLARAIVSIPSELFTVTVNNAKQEAELVNAQTALVEAQMKQLEAKANFEELIGSNEGIGN